MLKLKVTAWASSLFTTFSYLLCVGFGLLTPSSVHMHQLLELLLPGFRWLSVGAFFLGLIESFLWGLYLGGGFVLVYNLLCRRLETGRS